MAGRVRQPEHSSSDVAPHAPSIELRHLRAFLALAEDLHFTHAAQRLHIAQQALSKHIRQLEAVLGVQLFHRTTRSVELTRQGQLLASRLAQPLQELVAVLETTRHDACVRQNQLAVAFVPTLWEVVMPAVLQRITECHPGLKLTTYECWSAEAVSAVSEGRADVALVYSPPLDDGLVGMTFRHEPLGVILPARPPWTSLETVPVDALDDLTLTLVSAAEAPGFYARSMAAFPHHEAQRQFYELEHISRDTFFGDPFSRAEVTAGRAFFVTVRLGARLTPRGYVWLPLTPLQPVPIDIVYRGAIPRAPVRLFADLVNDLAVAESWLTLSDTIPRAAGGA
jgi:DNA-binding transcriptional LysR family regulator